MHKSRLRYIFTWAALLVLLTSAVALVVLAWNSRGTDSPSPALVVMLWCLISASGIYLFMLAVKKAHRQWITDKREQEEEKKTPGKTEAVRDQSRHSMDFSSVARKLVRRIPEDATLEDIGTGLLKHLASDLEIMSGIFYAESKGTFKVLSTYALMPSEQNLEFKSGEGLNGQAARNQHVMVLTRLPDGYLEVCSGLGKSLPSYLALVPLIHKGRTIALIECTGFRYEPQEIENMFRVFARELMNKLSPHLA